ncbi:hypothetical protein A5844_001098 [Enterococcus sp. 10A9_DIV0425]|uniref:Uncharacterized protein n=1 Tax=Candidatus Enterococcus wittei TaxID=1987383 RepID=A0A242K115_9ENTE|nr:hypothetical protein [Enterococcus sp. 10A9_DIV0425]OTP10964.1 hypothetical protein A5844_001098 [Enterococcus sp. 10A9_DIV0425]THE16270.1 hypothetical protein E1H99_00350 [Enterococcus hirae]
MVIEVGKEMKERKAKEFEKRVDMLALTLSLKGNDQIFETKEGYQLLFSTYIKMIENDQEDFFIEKERKKKIIQSLERTKAFYDFENKKQLQEIFKKMTKDDPADFMLFPTTFLTNLDKMESHIYGLTVYRKNKDFIVMKVDKSKSFDGQNVSYFKISSAYIAELSQLFFEERDFLQIASNSIFEILKKISDEAKTVPSIIMRYQKTDNCVISEVEASLRMILFNCRTDIFSLTEDDYCITPKWNLKYFDPTVEMRRRFVAAMKGEDKNWNQHFDYIFDYYLYRKGKLVRNSFLELHIPRGIRHWIIQDIFSMDTYIPEMLKNGGQIPAENVPLKEEKIRGIDPTGILDENPIKEINSTDLEDTLEINTHKIKLFNERLSFIKIQRARETTRYIISRLKEKNQEIVAELQRRKELGKGSQDGKSSNHDQLVPRADYSIHRSSQPTLIFNTKSSVKEVVFDELIERAKKAQYELQNSRQTNVKKLIAQYEKQL